MRAVSLLYHDVVGDGDWDSSGFSMPGASKYKLERGEFERHISVIATQHRKPIIVTELLHRANLKLLPFLLTFDDGGISAYTVVGEMFARLGWVGHFFLTTSRIGTRGFLEKSQIRALKDLGHCIGSHSVSHPEKMSSCTRHQLLDEWKRSTSTLSDILGCSIDTASVPGGFYSRGVAETAEETGIRVLFTSEPVTTVREVGACLIIGRYTIVRGMDPSVSANLVSSSSVARIKQSLQWNTKKVAKILGGQLYSRARKLILKT